MPVNAPTKVVAVIVPPLVMLLLLRLIPVDPAVLPATSTCASVGVADGVIQAGARVVPCEERICPAVPLASNAVVLTAD